MTGRRIAEAGVYDMPISEYVADPCVEPSLSSSIATLLLTRTPAHAQMKHPRLTPQVAEEKWSEAANFGSAVHAIVFRGPDIAPIEVADWKTKDARKLRGEAIAAGKIPLLAHDVGRARTCAKFADEALHTLTGGQLLDVEKTWVWQDGGVWCRCRPDAYVRESMRHIIDLKVTGTNALDANRQFFSMGYDMQAALYEAGANAIDPAGRGRRAINYLFIEDEPPFTARALPVSEATLTLARKQLLMARNIWRECLRTKTWNIGPLLLPPSDRPAWQEAKMLERELNEPHLVEEVG